MAMMRNRSCTFKCFVICFGLAGLVLIARRNSLWKKSFSTKDWSALNHDHKTLQSSHPQIHARPCIPERVPDSITRLNKMYDDVKTFVMFIGYSQSVESLTGAILDGHPEILISQEYDVIGNWKMYQDKKLRNFGQQKYMLFFDMHYLSTFQAVFQNKANNPSQFWLWTSKSDGIQYNFVPGAWQGTINGRVKVIGDTSGGVTSMKLTESKSNFEVLEEIQKVVGISIKFIHIISNPFDVIASSLIRRSNSHKEMNNTKAVRDAMKKFFTLVETNERIRNVYGDALLELSSDQLIFNPRKTLKKICIFLDVKCYDSYLNQVVGLLEGHSTRSRDQVVWTKEEKELVTEEMAKYTSLRSFTFDY